MAEEFPPTVKYNRLLKWKVHKREREMWKDGKRGGGDKRPPNVMERRQSNGFSIIFNYTSGNGSLSSGLIILLREDLQIADFTPIERFMRAQSNTTEVGQIGQHPIGCRGMVGDRNLFFKKQIRFSHPAAVVIIVLLPLDSSYSSKIHSYSLDINYTNYLINRRPTTKWLKRLHRGDSSSRRNTKFLSV